MKKKIIIIMINWNISTKMWNVTHLGALAYRIISSGESDIYFFALQRTIIIFIPVFVVCGLKSHLPHECEDVVA